MVLRKTHRVWVKIYEKLMAHDDRDMPSSIAPKTGQVHLKSYSVLAGWSYPALDAVAKLIERESAVGKTAVCGLNSGSVSPMFSCIETEFGIR